MKNLDQDMTTCTLKIQSGLSKVSDMPPLVPLEVDANNLLQLEPDMILLMDQIVLLLEIPLHSQRK